MTKINVMIDIETLGTKPGSAILEIGANIFRDSIEVEFYKPICLKSNLKHGMTIDLETLAWWQKQPCMEKVFTSKNVSLTYALDDFTGFVEDFVLTKFPVMDKDPWKEVLVWGNGASFDAVLMEEAYRKTGKTPPWKYWNVRDVRTLFTAAWGENFYKVPKIAGAKEELKKNGFTRKLVEHSSVDDALLQSQMVLMAQRKLGT